MKDVHRTTKAGTYLGRLLLPVNITTLEHRFEDPKWETGPDIKTRSVPTNTDINMTTTGIIIERNGDETMTIATETETKPPKRKIAKKKVLQTNSTKTCGKRNHKKQNPN
jgi:hypothetical protein